MRPKPLMAMRVICCFLPVIPFRPAIYTAPEKYGKRDGACAAAPFVSAPSATQQDQRRPAGSPAATGGPAKEQNSAARATDKSALRLPTICVVWPASTTVGTSRDT